MPKLVKKYYGRILTIISRGTIEEIEWSWRTIFIGLRGEIKVYKSEKVSPGKPFIYMKGTDSYIRTGIGEMSQNGDIITFTTKNSIYKFLVMSKNLLEDDEEKKEQNGDT